MAKLQKEVDRLEGNDITENEFSMHIQPPLLHGIFLFSSLFCIKYLHAACILVVCICIYISRLETKLSMPRVQCLSYRDKQINLKVLFF